MDSSKHHTGTEGCSSSESGWTMYIASPMLEDDDCSDDADEHDHGPVNNNGKVEYDDDDDRNNEQDSDDSMASDASSGPHHHHQQESHQDYGRIAASFKRSKGLDFSHCSSATKTNKKETKNDGNSNGKNRRVTANRKYSK